ncbi:hypothetical protein [Streptomyces alanosinicus]|uniref:Uncharacterized protein n=1 Tax=Streptomyces alanosinicus TaxID=68171 RepID=A0A918YK35_9ACTN|nr:hypothetical protein [Streptomyces alanosinicus]GHE06729.1 hypothetical protein GCM10010339_48970 [Streptomyces alanosinicus]
MRETPDQGRKRIDLSVPQVAGSALAAVVAAKLASYFGVYGTILGAGVVSIVATCGGTLFQHFFKRTGEQLKEATVTPRPADHQVPLSPGEFTEGTVYRARLRSWRRPVVAAALVFGVTMAGITTYELVSDSTFSGGAGTTVGDAFTGRRSSPSTPDSPAKSDETRPPSGASPPAGTPDSGGGTAHSTPPPTPGDSPGGEPSDGPSPSPTPTPSGSATTPTPPEPSASSRSGTAVPGQGGPSAQ